MKHWQHLHWSDCRHILWWQNKKDFLNWFYCHHILWWQKKDFLNWFYCRHILRWQKKRGLSKLIILACSTMNHLVLSADCLKTGLLLFKVAVKSLFLFLSPLPPLVRTLYRCQIIDWLIAAVYLEKNCTLKTIGDDCFGPLCLLVTKSLKSFQVLQRLDSRVDYFSKCPCLENSTNQQISA